MRPLATSLKSLTILASLLIIWQATVTLAHLPAFILPSPLQVAAAFRLYAPELMRETATTLLELGLGFTVGVSLGIVLALLMARCRLLQAWTLPILIISQAIPTLALAPLLVIWLGYGLASKIAVIVIMVFFPVTSSFLDGLKHTPREWLDLATVMQATPAQKLLRLQIPAALPRLASGLRIAAAVAPLGAIAAEWVGASHGLGLLLLTANATLQTDLLFADLIIIILCSLTLYYGVDQLAKWLIFWQSDSSLSSA